MKCLVTGAAGFIGSNLASYLIGQGAEVFGVDNFLSGKHANLGAVGPKMHFVEGDVRDGGLMGDLCREVTHVFHLAALASVPQSIEDPALAHDQPL